MMTDELLRQAIKAIKTGDKRQGRELIAEILKADRDNEQAWLWLVQADTTKEEKVKALKQVLRINPYNEAAKKKLAQLQKPQSWRRWAIVALVITICICGYIGSLTNPTPKKAAPTPTTNLALLSPEDRLLKTIELSSDSLSERLQHDFRSDGTLYFQFTVRTGWSQDSIAMGAKFDMSDILQSVASSDVSYKRVQLVGTFPTTDDYGNKTRTKVIDATYTAATIRRINFDNFQDKNIFSVADDIYVHPDLR